MIKNELVCCGISFLGYNKKDVQYLLQEKNKLIELQEKDVEALKREIQQLKYQINCSKNKKK